MYCIICMFLYFVRKVYNVHVVCVLYVYANLRFADFKCLLAHLWTFFFLSATCLTCKMFWLFLTILLLLSSCIDFFGSWIRTQIATGGSLYVHYTKSHLSSDNACFFQPKSCDYRYSKEEEDKWEALLFCSFVFLSVNMNDFRQFLFILK
jgi:hypothetical protein